MSLIIDHALPDYRWSFLISVAGLTKTPYCDLDAQLHGIQNQLKSKLNEQQAALELLKKQHNRERVRWDFKIIFKVPKYSSISSDWNIMLVYSNFCLVILGTRTWYCLTYQMIIKKVSLSNSQDHRKIQNETKSKSSGDSKVGFEMEIFKFFMKQPNSLRQSSLIYSWYRTVLRNVMKPPSFHPYFICGILILEKFSYLKFTL